MHQYKIIFQPLNLLDKVDNLLSDLKHICNNGDKKKVILFIFDDKTSTTPKLFEKYNKDQLDILLKEYFDQKLNNLICKNNKNPYIIYEKHINKTQSKILDIVNIVKEQLLFIEKDFNTKIYTIILPQTRY